MGLRLLLEPLPHPHEAVALADPCPELAAELIGRRHDERVNDPAANDFPVAHLASGGSPSPSNESFDRSRSVAFDGHARCPPGAPRMTARCTGVVRMM